MDFDSHFAKFKQTSEEIIINLKDRITENAIIMVNQLNSCCTRYLEIRPASKRRLRKRFIFDFILKYLFKFFIYSTI